MRERACLAGLAALALVLSGCASSDSADAEVAATAGQVLGDGEGGAGATAGVDGSGEAVVDAADVVLPAAEEAERDATVKYLTGEGRQAVDFVAVAAPLRDPESSCADVAAGLDAVGAPGDLLTAISSVPDRVLRDVLVGLFDATSTRLAACTDAGSNEVDEVVWYLDLAARRFDELGVAT